MKPYRATLRATLCLLVCFVSSALQCTGDTSTPNNCSKDQDFWWEEAELQAQRNEPRRCPYIVGSPNRVIPMSAFVDAPSDWYFQKTVSATPYNAVRALIGATAFGAYRYYEFCDLVYCEFLSGNFTGASTTPIRDSISLLSDIEGYGFYGRAWLILTGMVAIEATVMGGPSGVPLGATYTWNAQTSGDTAGYMYKWFADGQEVSGAVGNRYSRYFSTSGSHPLRVIATRSDYTADTADKTVSVYSFSASINGPTSGVTTASNCQVTYYASVSGGVGGLSYQWNVDSGVMITENYGSSIVVRMVAQGERSISVTVTDGNGNQTGAGIQVQVGQYDDSNCGLG